MQTRLIFGCWWPLIGDCTFGFVGRRCCSSLSSGKWDVFAGLLLERRPVITPEMNKIEKAMHKITLAYELNRSLLSDHEVRMIRDKERLQRLSSGVEVSSEDFDKAALETAQEFEDKSNNELKKLAFAPRKTKDDETNNTKSLNRCLDHRLLFFINSKIDNHDKWTLPYVKIDNQPSLRDAIDELISKLFPENQLTLKVLGNSPLAVYTYKYGKQNKKITGANGAKVFILKGYHISGTPSVVGSNEQIINDYKWLTINESSEILPSTLWKTIKQIHIDDTVPAWVPRTTISVITQKKEEAKAVVSIN